MAAKKRNALGRGLGALLEDTDQVPESTTKKAPKETKAPTKAEPTNFAEVAIGEVEINPYQPRVHFDEDALDELAESIRVQGIIQPITVRKLTDKKYQLISGERRFRASQLAGLEKVPAYIRTANDQEMLEMALIENIQRQELNAIEVALSYQRLMNECKLKQEQLGERVGKKRSTVNNYLRLLKLPPDIQLGVKEEKISMGHARALLGVENVDMQLALYKRIINENLSVRKTEELAKTTSSDKEPSASTSSNSYQANPEMQRLQQSLSSHFGTKVNVSASNQNKGEIKIPFVSVEDLNRILEILDI
ncbi:MAG: ParB/RepB/Spo0J family partition protein [Cyclobacteriaceae bacterium]